MPATGWRLCYLLPPSFQRFQGRKAGYDPANDAVGSDPAIGASSICRSRPDEGNPFGPSSKTPLKNILSCSVGGSTAGGVAAQMSASFVPRVPPCGLLGQSHTGMIGTPGGALIAVEDLRLWSERRSQCIGRVTNGRSAGCLTCFLEQKVSFDPRGQACGLLAHLLGVQCKSILQRQESSGSAPLLHLYRPSPDCSGPSVPTWRPPSQISTAKSPTRP